MIDLSQELIFSLIIRSFVIGIILGSFYESIRVCKMLLGVDYFNEKKTERKCRRILSELFTFFADILFCLFISCVALLITYNVSGGIFRGCVYICMFIGILIYRITFGRLALKIEKAVVTTIKKILCRLLRLVIVPLHAIFSLSVKIYDLTIGKIIGKIRGKMRDMKFRRQKTNENENAEIKMIVGGEEDGNVDRQERYKREGRQNFGGHRAS